IIQSPPRPTLFPYTTLFRSVQCPRGLANGERQENRSRPFTKPEHEGTLRTDMGPEAPQLCNPETNQRCIRRSRPTFKESVVCIRSEEHTSELQSRENLVCRL